MILYRRLSEISVIKVGGQNVNRSMIFTKAVSRNLTMQKTKPNLDKAKHGSYKTLERI